MAKQSDANLAVLIFEGQDTAEAVYEEIEQMEKEKLLNLEDAVIIEYEATMVNPDAPQDSATPQGLRPSVAQPKEYKLHVKQTRGKKGKYAAVGGGIGLLVGAIVGGPIGLMAVGAAGVGAITAALKDFGIDDRTVEVVKQRLQPDTSALMLLGTANDRDALLAKLREYDARVLLTSLDPEVERELVARLEAQS